MLAGVSITQLIFVSVAGLLVALLPILFFQSRRAERVMRGMQSLLLEPNRAKITDAKNMIEDVLADAISKINANFNSMATVLNQQAARAEMLEKKLGVQNKMLVSTADSAAERVSNMAKTLENLVANLSEIVASSGWKDAQSASENFNNGAGNLLRELEIKANSISDLSSKLNGDISEWSESGRKMSDELQQSIAGNSEKMNMMSIAFKGIKDELSGLQNSLVADFENVKLSSHGIESILADNEKLLARQLEKMENFTEQARKLLQAQVNTLSDTASRIGTDIRLAESSIGTGADNLGGVVEKLFQTSKTIKETFDSIAREIMDIRMKFQNEVGEFSDNVVKNLQNAQSATTHTMQNAGQIAAEFRDSLVPMLSNISGTLDGLESAKERMQPLSELMQRLEIIMPKLADKSGDMTEELTGKIGELVDKINSMNEAAAGALRGIGDSTLALEKLSGESRQQMIDLMGDYAKAATTMRELTASMAEARASAPMKAMAAPSIPKPAPAAVSVQDFTRQIGGIMEKLHDLSVDLTRSIGAEIPDSVMRKYNDGDRAIFSKWFAKMIKDADKKRVRNMFKNDAVFRSQATQFVHGFAKMLSGAERTENKEMVVATLLKTDLGVMYQTLRACL
jgi:ABC-type transporter Mla subunit MlaD